MAVINNLNTAQTPLASGKTGTQVVKFIPAPRVYAKAKDGTATPITVKSNGSLPTGYTDLGIVAGTAKVTYEKEVKEVRTGVDNVLRATYIGQKTATVEFNLSQFDDVVMEQITGLTASQITSGSVYQFAVGQEDIVEKAILLVNQNKLDGKEWQFYNPAGQWSFTLAEDGDAQVVAVKVNLPVFAFGGKDTLFIQTIFG